MSRVVDDGERTWFAPIQTVEDMLRIDMSDVSPNLKPAITVLEGEFHCYWWQNFGVTGWIPVTWEGQTIKAHYDKIIIPGVPLAPRDFPNNRT